MRLSASVATAAVIWSSSFELSCRASTIATTATKTTLSTPPVLSTQTSVGACEARTINYITQSLSAVCLRNGRMGVLTDPRSDAEISHSATDIDSAAVTTTSFASTASIPSARPTVSSAVELAPAEDEEPGALDDATFLSFEDWKKKNQDTVAHDVEKARKDRAREILEASSDGEINLDFDAFIGEQQSTPVEKPKRQEKAPTKSQSNDETPGYSPKPRAPGKDVGKTCKERFNFASLDVGGQVMKTNPEAKASSALLSENRDAYMLNVCGAKNKFFIVELSESIFVETVAMANYEFFSSTFRQFRVSVSDKYPQKPDRWVELGVFEARNTRDIQAFLIQDPRIWARYLRIEFINHYGNEFYCPVSLLRVHGVTPIQEIENMEKAARGEDDIEDDDDVIEEDVITDDDAQNNTASQEVLAEGLKSAEDAVAQLIHVAEAISLDGLEQAVNSSHILDVKQWLREASPLPPTTPWSQSNVTGVQIFANPRVEDMSHRSDDPAIKLSTDNVPGMENLEATTSPGASAIVDSAVSPPSQAAVTSTESAHINTNTSTHEGADSVKSTSTPSSAQKPISVSIKTSIPSAMSGNYNASNPRSNRTSSTSSATPPHPTTQESFFKTVSKRLQLLEANSTLSLKYIEEQSKILREAFAKVEKRQLNKTTSFLGNLNSTVLSELRRFGQQYDQIWQSTVIELETQRDQSLREMAAVSTRLNLLADELVFQKRMSIVQSVLLLLCLGLVIFSRSFSSGFNDVPLIQNMLSRARSVSPVGGYDSANSAGYPVLRRSNSRQSVMDWQSRNHSERRLSESSIHSAHTARLPEEEIESEDVFTRHSPYEDNNEIDGGHSDEEVEMSSDGTLAQVRHSLMGQRPAIAARSSSPQSSTHVREVSSNSNRYQWHEGDEIPQQALRPTPKEQSLPPLPASPASPTPSPPPREHILRRRQGSLASTRLPRIDMHNSATSPRSTTMSDSGRSVDSARGRKTPDSVVTYRSRRASENNLAHNRSYLDLDDDGVKHLPSPPPEHEKPGFVIARKPLPAIPQAPVKEKAIYQY